jgi:ABC-2 type transport system ATP-binding protein
MLEIMNCTKRYGDLIAVNNLSFKVERGEIAGLLGPNGAGKTTTIKMIVGLLRPDEGRILINGYEISSDPANAKRLLAYVPEKPYLYERLTAWEYLRFIQGLYSMDNSRFETNATEYLKLFGLYEWRNELIGNFSMGMKQRLVLTSILMREPELIILDEPHNGLDPKGLRLLKEILYDLRRSGRAILLSTHIIAIAEETCDKIAIMDRGSIIAQGTPEDLRHYASSSDKTLEDIFIRLTTHYEER